MAVVRSIRKKAGSRYKTRKATYVKRAAGSYGLYRSTRFSGLRSAARKYKMRIGRIPRTLNPFPNSKLVRHNYCDTVTLSGSTAAGLPTGYVFRTNSMYDPDYTGVGHQPMFRDEMAAQYNFYTVLSSKIQITMINESTVPVSVALFADDDYNWPATPSTLQEQHRFTKPQKVDKRIAPLILNGWYNGPKWYKTNRTAFLADIQHKTGAGSNPTESKYFNYVVMPHNSSDLVPSQKIHVKMTFVVLWREPVDHLPS